THRRGLRLSRRPGERLAGRKTLERVVCSIRAGGRQAHVEVERVDVAVRSERSEAPGAETGEGAAVDRRAGIVGVLVDLQLQLPGESGTASVRAGQDVAAGER